jgi:pyruvate formate lyase activating enzyme
MIERKALVFNIQKYNTHDGHGVRTLVFFKGCPLRCQWCSNPEGQLRQYQVLYKKDLCIHCGACASVCPVGIHTMARPSNVHEMILDIECIGCRKCQEACTASALAVVGEMKTISELMAVIEEDRPFYDVSDGGVTLGGGEPMFQPEVAMNLLMTCRQRSINTAVETCGYAKPETVMQIAEFTDLFLFDVKHMNSERHYQLTGVRNESILGNLKMLLEHRCNVRIRLPLLKNINDSPDNCQQLVNFLMPFKDYKNFSGIDILPYHKLGVHKYAQLGRKYQLKGDSALSDSDLDRIAACFSKYDFPVSVLRH